jgi:putative Mg2+ transporter-C (MgtC) family protein
MLVPLYQWRWMPGSMAEAFRTDPTRMAQGIMTGIGFLGAGAILKEGINVRGLTTAASIWITAAIGILFGVGFYYPAILTTGITLGVLMVFLWVEARLPSHVNTRGSIRFERSTAMSDEDVRKLLKDHGFSVASMSYLVSDDGAMFEYRMLMQTARSRNVSRLVHTLRMSDRVRGFEVSPTGD